MFRFVSPLFIHLILIINAYFHAKNRSTIATSIKGTFFSGPHSSRMVTSERQRLLQEQYYFLCQCEACSVQEGRQQQDGARGSKNESGLLCFKCKEALKVCYQSNSMDLLSHVPEQKGEMEIQLLPCVRKFPVENWVATSKSKMVAALYIVYINKQSSHPYHLRNHAF